MIYNSGVMTTPHLWVLVARLTHTEASHRPLGLESRRTPADWEGWGGGIIVSALDILTDRKIFLSLENKTLRKSPCISIKTFSLVPCVLRGKCYCIDICIWPLDSRLHTLKYSCFISIVLRGSVQESGYLSQSNPLHIVLNIYSTSD